MQVYVDTSALVKLVAVETETVALRGYLERFADDIRFTSALARTELVRAVARQGPPEVIANARMVLTKLDLVAVSTTLLDVAATITPFELRALDAIHLAAARTAPQLRAMITYDNRLADAAIAAGIAVVSPG